MLAVTSAFGGRDSLQASAAALKSQQGSQAIDHANRASERFDTAQNRLASPLLWGARWVPVVSSNIRTIDEVVASGRFGSRAAEVLSKSVTNHPPTAWRVSGRFNLQAMSRSADDFAVAAGHLNEAGKAFGKPRRFVVPPLASAASEVRAEVLKVGDALEKASSGLRVATQLLGFVDQRSLAVVFSNIAELRGSGGLFGSYVVMRTDEGKVTLDGDAARPTDTLAAPKDLGLDVPEWYSGYEIYDVEDTWQNVNVPLHFPAAASLLAQGVSQERTGVDAVIQVDPVGLSALLALTPPVVVEPWHEPVSSDNVASIMLHDAYVRFEDNPQRIAFLGRAVGTIFKAALGPDSRISQEALEKLGHAVASGNIKMWSSDEAEQQMLSQLGVAGDVDIDRAQTETVALSQFNAIGNKADWFLRREIEYSVSVDPKARSAKSTAEVKIENLAPSEGLPDYVIGSLVDGVSKGANRSFFLFGRGPDDDVTSSTLNRDSVSVLSTDESTLRSYHLGPVVVDSKQTAEIEISFDVENALIERDGLLVYRLAIIGQSLPFAEKWKFRFDVPAGYKALDPTTIEFEPGAEEVIEVRLRETLRGRMTRIFR